MTFALLFQFAESPHPNDVYKSKIELETAKNDVIKASWGKVCKQRNLTLSLADYKHLFGELNNLKEKLNRLESFGAGWSFLKSFYFTVTIITTIGYGDITPKTTAGMWLAILAGFLGVPIMLLTLKSLGEFINDVILKVLKLLEKTLLKRSNVKHLEFKMLIITLLMMVTLLLIGATHEMKQNDWSLLEGVYAWFITMSTIGFGDFVVAKSYIQGKDYTEKPLFYSAVLFLFLIFGLGVVASVINAVGEFLETNKYVRKSIEMCFGVGGERQTQQRRHSTSDKRNEKGREERATGNINEGISDEMETT